jgi:predicted DNA-binding transcriptional regulator YafY
MRRTERLFQIIQVLRSRRRPVTARELADELEVSVRTLYRDMAELSSQRVPVRGEAGTGYVIGADYDMPPLMLTADELEAAALGAAWVAQRGDAALTRAARDLLAKVVAAVPEHLRSVALDAGLRPVSFRIPTADSLDLAPIREAIRDRRKVRLDYIDANGARTDRIVKPFLIAYAEEIRLLVAYCELRQGFRHFRTDRVAGASVLDEHFRERTADLLRQWQEERRACEGDDRST